MQPPVTSSEIRRDESCKLEGCQSDEDICKRRRRLNPSWGTAVLPRRSPDGKEL